MRRLIIVSIVLALAALPGAPAQAKRKATKAESAAMWRGVGKELDDVGRCKQRRGVVSTVKSKKYRWGKVTIADATCGNGEFVLRKRLGSSSWKVIGAGSDWGNPDRCAEDLRKMPRRVLQDLFRRSICG